MAMRWIKGMAAWAAVGAGAPCAPAWAGSFQAVDAKGSPLADVAVWLAPADPKPAASKPVAEPAQALGQRAKMFEALVTVVEQGRALSFPNHDVVRHHVYSFSEPKKFDLKLYAEGEAPSVVFDKQGLVVLGCNIHDSMLAYVRVVGTPWHGVSGPDGKLAIDAPKGAWKLWYWHPSMGEDSAGKSMDYAGGDAAAKIQVGAP